jgi:hypothetical protein
MTADEEVTQSAGKANGSTGPKSDAGKAIVSQNSTRHGFLCRRLFIGDEDPIEFQALMDDLTASLNPVGALELALIEKIGVIMWRQRRLVCAETAALTLQQQPVRIVKAINGELLRGYQNEVTADQLEPFDADREQWCRAALAEFEALEAMDLPTIEANAPNLYGQLVQEAEGEDVKTYSAKLEHGIEGFLIELAQWCRKELKEADARPHLHAVANLVRERSLVLAGETLELFSRYQTTLDSHLYKAMRALRDTQEARLRTLEVEPQPAPARLPERMAEAMAQRQSQVVTVDLD